MSDRAPGGLFAKGNKAAVGGNGRPPLPEWLKAKGPAALQYICDVVEGNEPVDKSADRIKAAEIIIKRVYGDVSVEVDVKSVRQVDRLRDLLAGTPDEVDTP
jgi:hypothetical protein